MSTHRTRAEQRADAIDVSPTALTAEIERLNGELEAARKSADDYLAALQRERAEFQNFKRRTNEEREAMFGLAAESLLSKVLVVADDFDRAVEARPSAIADDPWVEGISAIDRKLRGLLESEGVREIDATPGGAFDPRLHEAIANVPDPGKPDGTIVDEVRRGYLLRDRVLRPALVAVATGGSKPPAAARADETGPRAGPNDRLEPEANPDLRSH
jgi:molecular chaperone GrpE